MTQPYRLSLTALALCLSPVVHAQPIFDPADLPFAPIAQTVPDCGLSVPMDPDWHRVSDPGNTEASVGVVWFAPSHGYFLPHPETGVSLVPAHAWVALDCRRRVSPTERTDALLAAIEEAADYITPDPNGLLVRPAEHRRMGDWVILASADQNGLSGPVPDNDKTRGNLFSWIGTDGDWLWRLTVFATEWTAPSVTGTLPAGQIYRWMDRDGTPADVILARKLNVAGPTHVAGVRRFEENRTLAHSIFQGLRPEPFPEPSP